MAAFSHISDWTYLRLPLDFHLLNGIYISNNLEQFVPDDAYLVPRSLRSKVVGFLKKNIINRKHVGVSKLLKPAILSAQQSAAMPACSMLDGHKR